MLNYFNAALNKLSRDQPFDRFADMAELVLDAGAVAIVDLHPCPTLIGCSESAAKITPHVVQLAASAAATDPVALAGRLAPLSGTPLPFAPPFSRVVNIAMVCAARQILCMVFPILPGIAPRRVQRFAAHGSRLIAENALIQRYRSDLRRYITMFDHVERSAKVGVWEADITTQEQFWSGEVFRIHEIPAGGLPPLINEVMAYYPEPGRTRLRDAFQELRLTGASCDVTLPLVTAAGTKRTVRVIADLQRAADGRDRFLGIYQDVTAQQEANERLWWTANHDNLTGLPNRALFADRFHKALERRKRSKTLVCLVLVDVDDFKIVNDTFGHSAGDELLRLVAKHLDEGTRAHDTVARTGGDEFSILLDDVRSREDLPLILARLKSALEVHLTWGERTMRVTMSAGAALAPDHGLNETELIAAADIALYRMKAIRAPSLALYEPGFGTMVEERSRLLAGVREALTRGRIVPHYQPQVDVATGRVVGVEALARWVTEEGVRAAETFAPAFDDPQLANEIGDAMADRAASEIGALNRMLSRRLSLSLNASLTELNGGSVLPRMIELANRGGIEGPLTIEIAEAVFLEDRSGTITEAIRAAADAGLRVSLGDFGSGYASLVQIATLPIAEVKVARRFIEGLEEDISRQKVLHGIIDLARTLGLRLVIEGIETDAQAHRIRSLGAHLAQGFLYAPALSFDALHERLAAELPESSVA
ncbi:putative bifunctional diguanylate cyclase/phosphodiesterase [Acuticoccus kandeliae]|uniref:putative bifunctional diguanylate cyclase/phosphodiesterase n=1 Tax=Acuticoccus kandeliae TaxID=2073160 RepID=UPI000D3EE221|nr:EAL domain-containing protein [Acuticoccus kandeliae]